MQGETGGPRAGGNQRNTPLSLNTLPAEKYLSAPLPSKEKGEAQEVSTLPRKGRTEAHSRELGAGAPALLPKALRCLERTQVTCHLSPCGPAGSQPQPVLSILTLWSERERGKK